MDEKDSARADSDAGDHPERIGPYRVLEILGEGGMGVVCLARQESPIRRHVAVKLVKLGMDTRQVLARFEIERQALAILNHPCVAGVLDAGRTEDGRPYFVMEHVPGTSILAFCDERRLSIEDRIELFIRVCDGVNHAHQKGIIHRDLKPSNILITEQDGRAVPKIIDFGIAKAVDRPLTEETAYTRAGQLVGTPVYMSPEQASSTHDIDTRTDVYSLGIVLYQMLSGELPYDFQAGTGANLDRFLRERDESDPVRPSARLRSEASGGRTAGRTRARRRLPWRELQGDLDWVVMKALERDRARRYGSVSELAKDLERYLRHEPVTAGAPGAGYRVGKFVRRHRVGVAALVVVVIAIVAGGTAATVGLVRARNAEREARAQAESAEAVAGFLRSLFRASDPATGEGGDVTARELLDQGADRIRRDLAEQPLVQARLMTTMGQVYADLGLHEEARSLLEEALQILTPRLGETHRDVARLTDNLGVVAQMQGDYPRSVRLHEKALALREALLGPQHPELSKSLSNLGESHRAMGDLDKATEYLERALLIDEQNSEGGPQLVSAALGNLAAVYSDAGEFERALGLLERALRISEETGDDPLETAWLLQSIGSLRFNLEDPGAGDYLERALRIQEERLGPDHPEVAFTMNNLADALKVAGDLSGALERLHRALSIYESALGQDHPEVAWNLCNLGEVLVLARDPVAAKSFFERSLEIRLAALPRDHPDVGRTLSGLGDVARLEGDLPGAEAHYVRALSILESSLDADHPMVEEVRGALIEVRKAGAPER